MELTTLTEHTDVHFFVYGTLKRGECRAHCWPRKPTSVQSAVARGELYDTGPFPAMIKGNDLVLGELWTFPQSDFKTVASVLDSVEDYREGRTDNLYTREIISCITPSSEVLAYIYLYARPKDLHSFRRVPATFELDGQKVAQWPTMMTKQHQAS